MEINGTSVVVTGASRGLGRAYALALAAAGASVVVNGRDEAATAAVVEQITRAGGTAVGEVAEVGTAEAAERLVGRAVEAFGRLDAMVCNAGITRDRVLWKMGDDDFDEVVRVHLRGSFTCGRAAAVRLREQGTGGTILLTSSLAGQRGNFGQTNYAAAKAGIAAMTRTWATELARAGITVNAVLPTAATRMAASIPLFAPYVEAVERGEPLPAVVRTVGAFGPPEDAAGLVVFLVSPAARQVTGQCIGVGGDRVTLWSHPEEIAFAYRDGGWSADALADTWEGTLGAFPQPFGGRLPNLPPPPASTEPAAPAPDGASPSRPAAVAGTAPAGAAASHPARGSDGAAGASRPAAGHDGWAAATARPWGRSA